MSKQGSVRLSDTIWNAYFSLLFTYLSIERKKYVATASSLFLNLVSDSD